MEYGQVAQYDKIIMNPPFNHAQDIRHIQRALSLLKPEGLLTAICLNGPANKKYASRFAMFGKSCCAARFHIPMCRRQ
ncbi:hypothetical protein [Hafnia alvei]|uniref:hypothetical protein n=1 Tax=Hafnia alvei TaxID=569 RepID=UPI0036F2074F